MKGGGSRLFYFHQIWLNALMGDHHHLSDSSQIWEITNHWTCSYGWSSPLERLITNLRDNKALDLSRLPGWYWYGGWYHLMSLPSTSSTSSTRSKGLVLPKVMLAWLVLSLKDQYQYQGTFQYPKPSSMVPVIRVVHQSWAGILALVGYVPGYVPRYVNPWPAGSCSAE